MDVNVVFKDHNHSPYIEEMLRQELNKIPLAERFAHVRAEISRGKRGDNIVYIGADASKDFPARVKVKHRSLVQGCRKAVKKFRRELLQLVERHRTLVNRRMQQRKENLYEARDAGSELDPIDADDIIKLRDAGLSDHHAVSVVIKEVSARDVASMLREAAKRMECLSIAKKRIKAYQEAAKVFDKLPLSMERLREVLAALRCCQKLTLQGNNG